MLTSEPAERLVKKLSRAVCADSMSPELSADPISESKAENDVSLELSDAVLPEALLVEELPSESNKLVSES